MSKGKLNNETEKVCPTCGITFTTFRINQKHCSDKCRVRSAEQRRYQKVIELKKYDPPKHCLNCGKRLEGRQKKFCSVSCKEVDRACKRTGVRDMVTENAGKCECTIKEKCEYGTNASGLMICGYMLMEGHSRGNYPDGDKCEFFKERKKKRKGKRWGNDLDNKWE